MPTHFQSSSSRCGWFTRLLVMAGSWLCLNMAGYACDPPAPPQPGVALATTKPSLAAGSRFPSARLVASSASEAPETLGMPGEPGIPGALGAFENAGMAALDDRRGLSIGDHLSFRILEDNDDPKQLVVTDTGEIEVPYVGRVQVRGMTCKQLAAELKNRLEARYYYHATVIIAVDVMGKALGKVYFSGALRTPGPLEIPGNEVFTLSKAILCAGGFTDFADKRNVKITRRTESASTNELFTVDVGQILEKGRTELDMPLEPGDMVFVPVRLVNF